MFNKGKHYTRLAVRSTHALDKGARGACWGLVSDRHDTRRTIDTFAREHGHDGLRLALDATTGTLPAVIVPALDAAHHALGPGASARHAP